MMAGSSRLRTATRAPRAPRASRAAAATPPPTTNDSGCFTLPVSHAPPTPGRRSGTRARTAADTPAPAARSAQDTKSVTTELAIVLLHHLRQLLWRPDGSGQASRHPTAMVENMPAKEDLGYWDVIERPIDLATIENRAREGKYATPAEFESDMMLLFNNARRVLVQHIVNYAMICVMQRHYQQLTAWPPNSTQAEIDAHIASVVEAAKDSHHIDSSVPVGPGVATPVPDGFGDGTGSELLPSSISPALASRQIPPKNKVYYASVDYKGHTYHPAEFIHLINKSDPTKPIVGQIFRVFQNSASQTPQWYVSVCWYYRPEDTVHPASRLFYEGEVFKTGLVVDHLVEDILEPTSVMYVTRYARGRLTGWDGQLAGRGGGEPYVVQYRYNETQRVFNKIKNWNSCVPEDVRRSNPEPPLVPFGQPRTLPKEESPFLRGIRGAGVLCKEEDVKPTTPTAAEDLFPTGLDEGKKRKRKTQASNPHKPDPPVPAAPEPLPPDTLDPWEAHLATYQELATHIAVALGDQQVAHANQFFGFPRSISPGPISEVDTLRLAASLMPTNAPHLRSTADVLAAMRDAASNYHAVPAAPVEGVLGPAGLTPLPADASSDDPRRAYDMVPTSTRAAFVTPPASPPSSPSQPATPRPAALAWMPAPLPTTPFKRTAPEWPMHNLSYLAWTQRHPKHVDPERPEPDEAAVNALEAQLTELNDLEDSEPVPDEGRGTGVQTLDLDTAFDRIKWDTVAPMLTLGEAE